MIKFDSVTKRYPGGDADNPRNALNDVTFELPTGDIAFLTGHSGAGKSTLLRLLLLAERTTHGQIWVNDTNITRLDGRALEDYRRTVGVVFQDHRLLMDHSVFENVALPLKISRRSGREIRTRVAAALEKVGLHRKVDALPIELSGGEQQRVGIARAVVNRPQIVIADEPTGNLDPQMSLDIMRLFAQFGSAGTTIIIATHDVQLVETLPHRRLRLHQGELM